jgi:uncharacterized protein YqeY
MSIAEKLKARTLELRKARDVIAPAFASVLADAQNQAIAKRIEGFTEEMALLAVNRAINQYTETLKLAPGDELTTRKLEALNGILPAKATDEEVRAEATAWFKSQTSEIHPKGFMGELMKHLMDKYGAALNRGTASQIVKEVLGG